MEVVGSDGIHVGSVDHLAIKLTKSDPGAYGVYHTLPLASVGSVTDKVVLNVTTAEARENEQAVGGRPSSKEPALIVP